MTSWAVLLLVAGAFLVPAHAGRVPDEQQLLALHNNYRAQHGAQPLTWSESLVASAERYANRCIWGHSSREERNGAGENLYFSMNMDVPTIGARASRDWYNEVSDYNFNSPGNARRWGAMIGHFTQMVWKDTKAIGCAYVRCGWMAGYSNADYIVCHYDPPGNWLDTGLYRANVLPPGTPAPGPAPAPAPAPARAPQIVVPRTTAWAAAPACTGSPTESNSVKDSSGRRWGFQRGVSCAFKQQPATPAKPSAPAKSPAASPGSRDAWDTAPPCPGRPNSNSVTDKQGRKWGMANGVSCAYRQRPSVVSEVAKTYTAPEQQKTSSPSSSSPAGAATASWPKTGDPLVDSVPPCEGVPTATNSITDAKGRTWGLLNGKSCAYRVAGSGGAAAAQRSPMTTG